MLNSHDLADKRVLAAVREYHALERKSYRVIKLDEPIQRGWRRFYVLAAHALRRRDSAVLEAILEVIGSEVRHHSPDFRRRRGRCKKLVEIEQPLQPIPFSRWEHSKYPEEWRSYFRVELLLEWNRHWQSYWVFKQPTLFELKIERNWLWYFREVDPAIETRRSELERWLRFHEGRERYRWLKGQHGWHWCDPRKQRLLTELHRREIARAIENYPEVDPAAPARRGWIVFRYDGSFTRVLNNRGRLLTQKPDRPLMALLMVRHSPSRLKLNPFSPA